MRLYSDNVTKEEEGEHIFVESVTYADMIGFIGGSWQRGWHYDHLPFFSKGTDASNYEIVNMKENITSVLPELYDWIKGTRNISDSDAVKTIMQCVNTP